MRLKTILMVAVGGILVIIVAAVVALRSIDFNTYKSLVAGQVKAATGRDLRIGGNLALEIGFSPAVVVEDVSFGNASWGSRPEMLKVGRFEVEVALLPLIFRDIRVKRLVLVQADILLETDAKGNGNWALGDAAPAPSRPAAKPGESKPGLAAVAVGKVRIEKGTLTFRDGKTKRVTTLALDRLDVQAQDATSPLTIDLAAAYQGRAFALAGTAGPLSELQAPSRPYPVKLSLKAGGATIEVDGTIAKPMEAAGLDLKVKGKGEEIAEVAKLAEKTVPALGPFSVSAQVTGSPEALSISGIEANVGKTGQVMVKATGAVKDALNARGINVAVAVESKDLKRAAKAFGVEMPTVPPLNAAVRVRDAQGVYAFDDLKATVGKSNVAGSGALAIGGPRPRIRAQLASAQLDLPELLPSTGATQPDAARSKQTSAPSQDKRVFPANPLPLGDLKAADADLDLKVDRLVLPNKVSVEALVARVMLSNGRLEVRPLSTRIAGGTLGGAITLDGSAGKTAALAAVIDAKSIDLGDVLRQMGRSELVTGAKTDVAMNLRGNGGSVREMMAGLNGDVVLVLGQGKIHRDFADWLGADLLTQIVEKVNPLRRTEPYSELKCGVIRFAARDGIASSDKGIAFETSKMTVVSSGTANLKSEAIDFTLRPEAREAGGIGAGELAKLLRVRGTLGEPKIGIDELEAAKAAVSIGGALSTGGLSSLAQTLAKKPTADPQPCETAKGRTPAPARTGSAPSAPAPAGQEAPKQGSGAEQLIRGLFGK
jgi:AsmA family protein